MKVLVTGATGFLGSWIVKALLRNRHRVRALVRRTSQLEVLQALKVERVEGDVLDRESVERALEGVDAVINTAAFVSFRPRDAEQVRRVNVEGTRHVLEAAARRGVRALHTSSIATIGLTSEPVALDENARIRPADAAGISYVASKLEAEELAIELASKGAEIVVLNPGILLGTGESHLTSTRSIVQFLRAPMFFYPGGGASHGHVRHVAEAYVTALARGRPGERYILAGVNASYREFLEALARLSGQPGPLPLPAPVARWWGLVSQASSWLSPHAFEEFNAGTAVYTARFNYCEAGKAVRELGYRLSDLDSMLRETVTDLLVRGLVQATTPSLQQILREARRRRGAKRA